LRWSVFHLERRKLSVRYLFGIKTGIIVELRVVQASGSALSSGTPVWDNHPFKGLPTLIRHPM
jgi:hypothetical protein